MALLDAYYSGDTGSWLGWAVSSCHLDLNQHDIMQLQPSAGSLLLDWVPLDIGRVILSWRTSQCQTLCTATFVGLDF